MVEGLGDAIKAVHVAGKSNKAIRADLERATGGNDLCFVTNRSNLPTTFNKHTLYVFLDENNLDETGNPSLTISSHQKQDIVLNDEDLPDGAVERLREEVRNIPLEETQTLEDSQALADTKALFKYARKEKILDKTLREKTLRAGAEIAAVGLTVAEGLTSLVAGRKHAPKGLRETTVRKTVKKGKQALSESLDKSTTGKALKNTAISLDDIHSKGTSEVAAVVATPLSAVSGAVMGRASAVPIPDSKFKEHVVQPAINAADNTWDKAKEIAPQTTKTIENALDAKNQFANSEFVSQGVSMAGGVTAALGVTTGVGATAPISIPILSTVTIASVGMSVNAETKRQELGREKQYLEDIAINAYRIQSLNEKFPNISSTLGIADTDDDHLRKMAAATSKTIGPNHSFAENGVAMTAAIHTPFVFVKSATAAVSPITLTLHGVGLANAMTTQVSGKFSETDAKYQMKSEIDTLRRIVPQNMNSDDIYVLANNAKNIKIEATALEAVTKQLEVNPSIFEDKEAMKAAFNQAKKDAEAKLSQGNNPIYSSQNLTKPGDILSKTEIHAQNTAKVLFGKKTSYQQNTGMRPETEKIINQLKPTPPSKDQAVEQLISPITVVAENSQDLVATPSRNGDDSTNTKATTIPTVVVQGVSVMDTPVQRATQIPDSHTQSSTLVSNKIANMRRELEHINNPPLKYQSESKSQSNSQRKPSLSGRRASFTRQ